MPKKLKLWFEREITEKMPFKLNFKKQPAQPVTAFNVFQNEDEVVLTANLPEFKKEEIKIKATSRTIDITAEKTNKTVEQTDKSYKQSSSSSAIKRVISLPAEINPNSIKAKFEDGILEVVMAKKATKNV